jgi:hypothetical protein
LTTVSHGHDTTWHETEVREMTPVQVVVQDRTVYEGAAEVVPRIGDQVRVGTEQHRVESVVWKLQAGAGLTATVMLEHLPYGS